MRKISHSVTCVYCQTKFDRDKEPYVQISARRYAHGSCALREEKAHPTGKKIEVIDPNNFVTCRYCKKVFDKSKEPFKLFSNGKYAHKACYELEQSRELTDQEKLERYIMKLFKSDYVYTKIQKQIKDYVTNHGYTYSGIQKALIYYYEIQGHPFDPIKAQGGIGIVPYVYNKAFEYYYAIWEAQQKQQRALNVNDVQYYIPKTIEINIPIPRKEIKKEKTFSFLDEDIIEGE